MFGYDGVSSNIRMSDSIGTSEYRKRSAFIAYHLNSQ